MQHKTEAGISLWESFRCFLPQQRLRFGSLEVRGHAARQGRNPATGETVDIAAKKVPAFKPAKALKDAVE